jgi:hypothetical protein
MEMSDSSVSENARIAREKKTIRAMIGIYCRGNHAVQQQGEVCAECQSLLA